MRRLLLDAKRAGLKAYGQELLSLIAGLEANLKRVNPMAALWEESLDLLPDFKSSLSVLDENCVRVGLKEELNAEAYKRLSKFLIDLIPWRKGPFSIFEIDIDAEWQSFMKWQRLLPFLPDLKDKKILDIGASNGYYLFRMGACNPRLALGLEPFLPYYYQFALVQKYTLHPSLFLLPAGFEELFEMKNFFDVIFCMGVLYHRRSPIEFLQRIKTYLKNKGELILETLVIEGDKPFSLTPETRYAKMRGIYFLPTISCLSRWLRHAGFSRVDCLDLNYTSSEEQRNTAWLRGESLEDFFDPEDKRKTIEGEQAPLRALISARP